MVTPPGISFSDAAKSAKGRTDRETGMLLKEKM